MMPSLLPEIMDVNDAGPTICAMPQLRPHFFVPRLEDKPQNPIMDTLRLWRNRSRPQEWTQEKSSSALPPELRLLSEDVLQLEYARKNQMQTIWTQAVTRRHGTMVRIPMSTMHLLPMKRQNIC